MQEVYRLGADEACVVEAMRRSLEAREEAARKIEVRPPPPTVAMIAAGDVVRLRSGGPDMTVEEVEGNLAHCCWFEPLSPLAVAAKWELRRAELVAATLERVAPSSLAN